MTTTTDRIDNGLLRHELRVGVVASVTAKTASVNLQDAGKPSGSYFERGRYGRGEVGEFVLVEGQQNIVLGRIIEIRLPEKERQSISQEFAGRADIDAIAIVQLLASIKTTDDLTVSAGVDVYPRLGDRVYAAQHQLIAALPSLMEPEIATNGIRLEIGSVGANSDCSVCFSPEKLFGRHCAILGSTGGGKSWTTARIIEECIQHESKLILLDASGEYRGFNGPLVKHCHLANPFDLAKESESCSLPPSCFQESDFLAMFDPAGKVQGPKLRQAIRSLRLATLAPQVATNGIIEKVNQSKAEIEKAANKKGVSRRLDDPRQKFDVNLLPKQIEQECVYPDGFGTQRGQKDTTKWGGESGEFSNCLSLVSRINALTMSPAFACVFDSEETSLIDEIDEFHDSVHSLLRIDLSGVAYEFNAREVITNAIGRHLLRTARGGTYREKPIVLMVDEAHNFLGRVVGTEGSFAKLDAFEIIAKEGRKYGLNICLATQRPRDITEGVLSQMGTLIVHRLMNDRDRDVVERASGEIDRSVSSFLPNLKPGEAAIIGVDFPIPMTIRIRKPSNRPKSDGPDFQARWKATGDGVDASI